MKRIAHETQTGIEEEEEVKKRESLLIHTMFGRIYATDLFIFLCEFQTMT